MRRSGAGRPVTRSLALALGVAALLLRSGAARAQLCHDLPDLESHRHAPTKDGVQAASAARDGGHDEAAHDGAHDGAAHDGASLALGLRLEAATAAIERRPIDYQGTTLRVDLHLRRLHLRAQSSWYRVRDSLDVTTGAGDVMVAAMWTAYQSRRVRAGLALPVGMPTGDAEEHLGMGHWMVMPGGFAALQATESVTASVGLAYNRALAVPEGHHHGIGPYVNPMTAEELGFAGRLAVRTGPALQVVAETALAVPFDASMRMIMGAGFSLQRQRVSISVLAQAGALHAPFTARGVADVSYAF